MTGTDQLERGNAIGTQGASWSPLFGLVAPAVGWIPPLRYLLRRARILRSLSPLPPLRLIEVGCGAGALLDDFARREHVAVGLESSPEAVARARALVALTGNTPRICTSVEPGWNGAFDLVCAFDVLEHIEDDAGALDTWLGWLKPGGLLCLSVPAHRSRWSAGDEWAGHWRRYDRADLLDLVRSRGLLVEHLECYGFPLANVTERVGRRVYQRLIDARKGTYSKQDATAASGIERGEHTRMFRWLDTPVGRFALRICLGLQALTARTDWGSGYLILVRRP